MLCDNPEMWDGEVREVPREEIYVYLWLIHTVVWQKPTQHCKTIILQLKFFKERNIDTIAFCKCNKLTMGIISFVIKNVIIYGKSSITD